MLAAAVLQRHAYRALALAVCYLHVEALGLPSLHVFVLLHIQQQQLWLLSCTLPLHADLVLPCVLQNIQERANRKEHVLALVNAERKATNDRKRIERELFDSLRRDKVDSIQKMQVRPGWAGVVALCSSTGQGPRSTLQVGTQLQGYRCCKP